MPETRPSVRELSYAVAAGAASLTERLCLHRELRQFALPRVLPAPTREHDHARVFRCCARASPRGLNQDSSKYTGGLPTAGRVRAMRARIVAAVFPDSLRRKEEYPVSRAGKDHPKFSTPVRCDGLARTPGQAFRLRLPVGDKVAPGDLPRRRQSNLNAAPRTCFRHPPA